MRSVPVGFQSILHMWAGKRIYFELQDGVWRIDMDRSIRYVIEVQKQRNGPYVRPSESLASAILEQQAKDWDLITGQIERGELPHLADGQRAVRRKIDEMSSKFGIYGMSTYDAPVENGNPPR